MRLRTLILLVGFFGLLGAPVASAAVLWDESISGDLSNSPATPNALLLSPGVNSIIGNVGASNTNDWAALTIPAGHVLVTNVLASYQSTDFQGFTGFQAGNTFVGSTVNPASYMGYAHFGTGALNGNFPTMNLVGTDLLALMADPTVSQGATGFTTPLAAGTYTFLIQQNGASTNYQFDFTVRQIPEPSWLALLGLAVSGAAIRGWRSRGQAPN